MQARDGRTQVVVFALQLLEPFLVVSPALRVGALGECLEIGGMPLGEGIAVGTRGQLLERELADGLEHVEALARPADHALVDERGECIDLGIAHGFRGFEREAAGKHRKPRKQRPFARLEELMAPLQRVAQRLLPLRQIARAPRQQLEAIAEALQQRDRREQRHSCCRQLDRQR